MMIGAWGSRYDKHTKELIKQLKTEDDSLRLVSEVTQKIMSKALESKDPVHALKILSGLLFRNDYYSCCRISKFSSSTGEPVTYTWSERGTWDGLLWLGGFNGLTLRSNSPLYHPLLKLLPVDKLVLVKIGKDKIFVKHHAEDCQGGGTVPAFIEFRRDDSADLVVIE
ncbi:MAG: hypothetical protein Q7S19_03530 [bacterium]|nr:hypothetical protein [bacterium]